MTLVQAYLVPALWFAWLVYWRISEFGVKPVARRESDLSRSMHTVPLALCAFLLALPSLPDGFLCERFLPKTSDVYWLGAAWVALGLGFAVWARVHLGGNWSGTVTLKHDHELIRSGPYRFVRHPIYTGLLAALLGSAIVRGEWRGLFAVMVAFVALWRKSRLEERWLGDLFGSEYTNYSQDVAALIPFIL